MRQHLRSGSDLCPTRSPETRPFFNLLPGIPRVLRSNFDVANHKIIQLLKEIPEKECKESLINQKNQVKI